MSVRFGFVVNLGVHFVPGSLGGSRETQAIMKKTDNGEASEANTCTGEVSTSSNTVQAVHSGPAFAPYPTRLQRVYPPWYLWPTGLYLEPSVMQTEDPSRKSTFSNQDVEEEKGKDASSDPRNDRCSGDEPFRGARSAANVTVADHHKQEDAELGHTDTMFVTMLMRRSGGYIEGLSKGMISYGPVEEVLCGPFGEEPQDGVSVDAEPKPRTCPRQERSLPGQVRNNRVGRRRLVEGDSLYYQQIHKGAKGYAGAHCESADPRALVRLHGKSLGPEPKNEEGGADKKGRAEYNGCCNSSTTARLFWAAVGAGGTINERFFVIRRRAYRRVWGFLHSASNRRKEGYNDKVDNGPQETDPDNDMENDMKNGSEEQFQVLNRNDEAGVAPKEWDNEVSDRGNELSEKLSYGGRYWTKPK
ncbi:hypothetical protein B0H17DRAFT_1131244 [Mycena rosella]|uniref:Uncharacterized protein n=1 Tax=Mycena rosella TaxID=1033263 RepID=A0AAD7DNN2_MYCRO|nr:hypothetical protein B0H17DRAFT_1131244 [Mycena rosella]